MSSSLPSEPLIIITMMVKTMLMMIIIMVTTIEIKMESELRIFFVEGKGLMTFYHAGLGGKRG